MISTHIVDSTRGIPAARMPVQLDVFITGQGWKEIGHGLSNDAGLIDEFGAPAAEGIYRMMFDVASYLPDAFYPSIPVTFQIQDPTKQFHIAVFLSPFGYSVQYDPSAHAA